MAEGVVDAISNFLDRFNPRTFQSDNQSSQYLFNKAKPERFGGGAGYPRLHSDFDETNAHLRSGEIDAPTQKFVSMMDASSVTTQDQLILSRTMGADSFGLTPETLGQENGGIEDFTGQLMADRGYTAAVIGTPMGHGPGKVTMSIAVPKGTKVIIPARSQTDRGIFFDKDQEFRITKVTPDGRGGFYMMAIATPRTPGQTPEPIDRGPRGVGLTPAQREAGVLKGQQITAKREKRLEAPPPSGQAPIVPHQASPTGPTDTGPNGPPPRNEPIHAPSIGTGGGPAPSEVVPGQAPAPQAPIAPQPPAPIDFRQVVRDAGLESPSEGPRRRQWNNAYLGIASGKKDPGDVLRELESDIKVNKHRESDLGGAPDVHRVDDIKKQEQLADLIAKQYGLQRAQEPKAPAPVKAVPTKVTPITQAPGEKHRPIPGETGTQPVTNLEARRAQKAVQAPRPPQQEPTPAPVPQKKATLAPVRSLEEAQAKKVTPPTPKSAVQRDFPKNVEVGDVIVFKKSEKKIARIERSPTKRFEFFDENGNRIGNVNFNGKLNFRKSEGNVSSAPEASGTKTVKKAAPSALEAPAPKSATAKAAPEVPEANRIPVRGGGFVDTRTGELHGGPTAPTPKTAKDLIAELRREDANQVPVMDRPQADEFLKPLNKTQLTEMAKELSIPGASSKSAVELRREIREATVGRRRDSIAIRGFTGNRPGQGAPSPFNIPKAAPAPAPANEPNLDKMTKAELLAHARRPEISANIRTSMTKDQIKQEIRRAQEIGPPEPGSRVGQQNQFKEAGLGGTVKELQIIADHEGVPRRGRPTNKAKLQEAILARRKEVAAAGAAEPNDNLISDLAKEVGIKGDGGGLIPARQLDLKQGLSEQEVADKIMRDADQLEASPMPAPGSDKIITKAMQDQRDQHVSDLRKLATRLRTRNGPPAEPNAPAAQKPIQAPDRREAFAEAWTNSRQLLRPPTSDETAAHRSAVEVRDDVLSGKLTPDEGIRRLENDIQFNKEDLAGIDADLRGELDPKVRSRLMDKRDKLRSGISYQENASSLMRTHFRNAPVVTPKEVEVQLDPEAKKLVDSARPADIKEAAKIGGFGELKGDTKDELLQDLVKKIAGKELESRAAKKAAPKKLAPAPLVTKKSGDPDYVDARAIAEGLDMNESDLQILKRFQDDLDGKNGQKTPAAVGREMENWAKGPGGPYWERVVHSQVTLDKVRDRVAGRLPSLAGPEADRKRLAEAEAKDAALKAQGDRWVTLAQRLQKTRRRPARKATESAPEKPKLTPEESLRMKRAAGILGVPNETLQKRALARKIEAAPPAEAAKSAVEQMRTMQSREEGTAFLKNRTKAELQEIAKASNMPYLSKDTKPSLITKLTQREIGARLQGEALRSLGPGGKPEPSGPAAPGVRPKIRAEDILPPAPEVHQQGPNARALANLENMSLSELTDLENKLGIKRTTLDRGERIAAIRKAQAGENASSVSKSLPDSGRKWNWQTIQEDNMVMHGDSASMNLAQKLHKAGREDQAQYVADMRYRISNPRGEHSPDDVEKMVKDLNTMMDAEQDPAVKGLYKRALDDIAAPETAAPNLPDSTPSVLRKMMDELNQIPVARRSGHFAGTTKEVSAVDRLAQLIQKVDSGNGGSIGTVEGEIRRILRSLHESVDGAMAMWRLESLIDDPSIKAWIRSFY